MAVRAPSQDAPEVVATLTLNETADPSLAATETFCAGAVPPTVAVKENGLEVTVSVGGPDVVPEAVIVVLLE